MPSPVLNIAQMRAWEQASWATGKTEEEVIRRVGLELARLALQLTQPGDLILILAGKGNNGQDARHAQSHLASRRVQLLDVVEPDASLAELEKHLSPRPALIIDGLFGIGLNRPLSAAWIQLIERINLSDAPILAVDVPSGLNADTGEPQGAAIRAAVTLTVGAPKIGLLQEPAWPFTGRVELASQVGLTTPPAGGELLWTAEEDFFRFPPRRQVADHKGTYGHLGILAGSLGFHGAAVLTAQGAQRSQPGLITLYTMESVYHPVAAQLQSVMVAPWRAGTELSPRLTAILVGPGLASEEVPEDLRTLIRRLWRTSPLPIIVDASALDWLAHDPVRKDVLRVITPHPGEAARILNIPAKDVQANRLNTLRRISQRLGNSLVVLKGHQTLVGRSAGEVFVNSSGNPHLGQGGSGDVLSGLIAGLLAQPPLQAQALKAVRYAVWAHGAAADRLQSRHRHWVVEDLLRELIA